MKTMLAQLMTIVCFIAITKNTCISQIIPDIDDAVVNSCVVSDVSGKVTYKENGAEMPVKAGTVLKEGATVAIPDGSSVTLAKDEQSLTVNKKGNYPVASMIKDVKEKGKASRFARMAYAAKGYGDTSGTSKPPIRKGWGDKDSLIFFPPINGKLGIKPVKISWTSLKEKPLYKLVIFQNSPENPVLSTIISNSTFTLDPNEIALIPNKPCFIQVSLVKDSNNRSKLINSTFVPLTEEEMVLESLKEDNEYKEGNAIKKYLMEAIALEENGFTLSAFQHYQKALEMNKENVLASKMYSAFIESSND